MSKPIVQELTSAQTAKFPEYRDKWLKIGLMPEDYSLKDAQLRVLADAVYKNAGLEPPKFVIRVKSPFALQIAAFYMRKFPTSLEKIFSKSQGDQVWDQVGDQVRDQVWAQVWDQVWDQVWAQVRDQVWAQVWDQVWAQVWDQVGDQVGDQVRAQVGDQVRAQVGDQVWDQVWDQVRAQVGDQVWEIEKNSKLEWSNWDCGAFEAGWMSWIDYFARECGVEHPKWASYRDLMSNVGWTVPLRGALLVCERPLFIHRDRFNRLHAEGRPAIAYSDGYKIYCLDGVRFPDDLGEKFVQAKVSDIKKEDVLSIVNVEQRQAVIKRIGVKEFLTQLKPTVLDTSDTYELLRVNIGNADRIYIKMQNPSIAETHIEAVHPECRTVDAALHWRNTGELTGRYLKPVALT